ncbi:MAG: hypothetical protein R3268_12855, partial [Acidiferrobacterales bacterium]|nr:hypothetical protein [Acidiferrobacterales bacterium]
MYCQERRCPTHGAGTAVSHGAWAGDLRAYHANNDAMRSIASLAANSRAAIAHQASSWLGLYSALSCCWMLGGT